MATKGKTFNRLTLNYLIMTKKNFLSFLDSALSEIPYNFRKDAEEFIKSKDAKSRIDVLYLINDFLTTFSVKELGEDYRVKRGLISLEICRAAMKKFGFLFPDNNFEKLECINNYIYEVFKKIRSNFRRCKKYKNKIANATKYVSDLSDEKLTKYITKVEQEILSSMRFIYSIVGENAISYIRRNVLNFKYWHFYYDIENELKWINHFLLELEILKAEYERRKTFVKLAS